MNKVTIHLLEGGGFTIKSTGDVMVEVVPPAKDVIDLKGLGLPPEYWKPGAILKEEQGR